MNFIGGSDSFRYFKIISVNNKKVKDEGRYKTKGSPGDAAKKAFTQLSKKYKTNKLIFSIKETTQGSSKKEHGPYLGEKIKLKKPLEVKYKGKNKPVLIKYETKIHLVKDHKQKGGNKTLIKKYYQKISTLRLLKDEGYNTKLLEEDIAKIENELLLEAYDENQINQVNKSQKNLYLKEMYLSGKKYTNRNNEEARLLRDGIEDSMSSAGEPVAGGPVVGEPVAGGPVAGGPVVGGPVANGRNLKLFFFDLDNTLTSKELENRDSLGFIKLATISATWVYTTNEVIQVLTAIHNDPNSRWYVISSGGNINVLDMLCSILGFQANGSVFNIQNNGDNKSVPISQIMEGLKNEGNILDKITFIDDTPDKIEEVKSSIPSMTTIPVESHIGECPHIPGVPDHMIDMFWKKIIQQSEMQQILEILRS